MNMVTNSFGPLFTGLYQEQVRAYMQVAEKAVAEHGVNLVTERLGTVLQNPTGYYESLIQTDRRTPGTAITDGWPGTGVLYGPWLEGLGSRNATTRFKGYFTFRLTTQQLQNDAGGIAAALLPWWLEAAG